MVEEEKPIKMDAATIWCDKTLLKEFKVAVKLQGQGRTLADELNELFRKRLAELCGTANPDTSVEKSGRKYEELKKRYSGLVKDVARMKKSLEEEFEDGKELFGEAEALFKSLSLREDFGNAIDVIPKFLASWKGSVDFAHEFISLVEGAREKKEVGARLREIRSAKPVDLGSAAPE